MSNTSKFDPRDLNPEALENVLQSLSSYSIPLKRLKFRGKLLGEGGFGTVELADLRTNESWLQFREAPTTVAVKELRNKGMELRMAFRFAREVKVWASCDHPNILKFIGYHLSKDFRQAYLISSYMKNGNVKDYLAREAPSSEQRLELVCDTITGLAYLHSRDPPIVHGDLKALNVLINDSGRALLSDFGLARAIEEAGATGLTTSNGFKGTIRYCSPEVLNGGRLDPTSDIWAWGCLALEIITDNPPYHEFQREAQILLFLCGPEDHRKTPEPSDSSSVHPHLLKLLRKCWNFEPGQRPDASQCVDESHSQRKDDSHPYLWDVSQVYRPPPTPPVKDRSLPSPPSRKHAGFPEDADVSQSLIGDFFRRGPFASQPKKDWSRLLPFRKQTDNRVVPAPYTDPFDPDDILFQPPTPFGYGYQSTPSPPKPYDPSDPSTYPETPEPFGYGYQSALNPPKPYDPSDPSTYPGTRSI